MKTANTSMIKIGAARRSWYPAIRGALVLLLLCCCLSQSAFGAGNAESSPNSEGPTEVSVDIYDLSIFNFDHDSGTYDIEARLVASWVDERLSFDPEEAGWRVLQGETASDALKNEVWWPGIEIVDARGAREILQRSIEIKYDGTVTYGEEFAAKISQQVDLEDFPFDEHEISFSMAPYVYSNAEVIFIEADNSGGELLQEPVEWFMDTDPTLIISNGSCDIPEDDMCHIDNSCTMSICSYDSDCPGEAMCSGFADATVSLNIERLPKYYLSNVILPLMLIVLISSAVFSMTFRTMHLGDRLSVSFTSVLTVVAFDFATSDNLPKLWYSTTLDNILTASYIFLTINVLQNVLAARINESKPKGAAILDATFRWGFPLAYLATVYALMFYYGNGTEWLMRVTSGYV